MSVNATNTFLERDAEFFFHNGFAGPFKLYEPDEAREILKEIRIKNFDTTKALFNNDVNFDRHFDISELSQHIAHPGIIRSIQKIIGPNILCWRTEFFQSFLAARALNGIRLRHSSTQRELLILSPLFGRRTFQ